MMLLLDGGLAKAGYHDESTEQRSAIVLTLSKNPAEWIQMMESVKPETLVYPMHSLLSKGKLLESKAAPGDDPIGHHSTSETGAALT